MRAGEIIRITAQKADGRPYRWWNARVERADAECVVTFMRAGEWLHEPAGGWAARHHYRCYYWHGRPFNLIECFAEAGAPSHLYVHLASPVMVVPEGLAYHDYELDVVKRVGQPADIRDEDEFAAAAAHYGYTAAFQARCWEAVRQAQELVERWTWSSLG